MGNELTVTQDLRAHAAHRMRFAMARFSNLVHRVRVRVRVVDGPRGGARGAVGSVPSREVSWRLRRGPTEWPMRTPRHQQSNHSDVECS